MDYNIQKHMKTIELDKVLELLAEKTACEDAADFARNLIPVTEIEEVQQMLSETDTAYQMMARFGAPSFYGLQQIVNSLRRAQSGGVLNLAEFKYRRCTSCHAGHCPMEKEERRVTNHVGLAF